MLLYDATSLYATVTWRYFTQVLTHTLTSAMPIRFTFEELCILAWLPVVDLHHGRLQRASLLRFTITPALVLALLQHFLHVYCIDSVNVVSRDCFDQHGSRGATT